MPRRLLGLLCVLLTTGLLLAAVPMGVIGDDETPVRVIVTFKDKVDEGLVKDNGGAVDRTLTYIPIVVADLKPKDIKKLEKSDKVKSVEEDAVAYAVDDADEAKGKPTPPPPPPPPAQETPWGIDRIDADLVWQLDTPSENTGFGVDVAILDTGIDTGHSDLNVVDGYNFVKSGRTLNTAAYNDDNGHGTHCAGIVAALDNDNGVIGVAPGTNLWAVKVLNKQGLGSYTNIISAIDWCIGKVDVISMSFSGGYSSGLETACQEAYDAGIVLVAAAGNSGSDKAEYPAGYSTVISVGATGKSDLLASWSNYGNEMDLVAPGVSIYSTYKGDTYKTLSGTSMACPHVAGTVALVLFTEIPTKYDSTTTGDTGEWDPAEVIACLEQTADDLGDNYYFGYGLVDAKEAATGTAS